MDRLCQIRVSLSTPPCSAWKDFKLDSSNPNELRHRVPVFGDCLTNQRARQAMSLRVSDTVRPFSNAIIVPGTMHFVWYAGAMEQLNTFVSQARHDGDHVHRNVGSV